MMHATATKPGLGNDETLSRIAEHILQRHPTILEFYVRVHSIALFSVRAHC
jgi:hypothetical protein